MWGGKTDTTAPHTTHPILLPPPPTGIEGVTSVQTILSRWVGDKDRIYTRHLERDLAEGCKCFDAARFELCLQAIGGMGPTYAAESAKGLPEKWATALGLISLASVMPYAISAAASASAGGGVGAGATDAFAPGATVRKLMKMVRSDAAAQALLQLLANAAYSVWCYNATIRLLRRTLDVVDEKKKKKKEKEKASEGGEDDDDDAVVSARRVFLRAMEQGRALFFGEVQDKVGECFASMHLHSLTLESFFVLIFAFRMLAALGRSFGEEMGKGVCVLYARFIAAYMGDVLHKEACEITRVGLVFDSLKPLSAAKVVERVSKQYEVATDGATPAPSPAAAAAAANPAMAAAAAAASAEIPASILLELIVRKTEAFLSSEDPSQSPFIRVLQNCQRRQAAAAAAAAPAASQNEHASALRSLFAPEELMVIQMNLPNMMNAAAASAATTTTTTAAAAATQAKKRPSQQVRKGSAAAAEEAQQQRVRHTIKAGAVTLPEVLTEGGVEAMLHVLRYCELLSSCGSSVGAESTELVGSLLLRYVSFYAYTTVMDYCGVAPRGAASSGCLQWFTHALNSAGSGAGEAPAVAAEVEEEAAAAQPSADAEAAAPAGPPPAAKGMTAAAAAAALELSGLLPRAIKGLGAFAPMQRDGSKQVAFLSYFAEQDARLPQEARATLLEMRAATLSVLGHKRRDAAAAAAAPTAPASSSSSSGDEADESSGAGGGGGVAASAEESAILAHHLRVQNPALLRRLSGAEGAAHAADERFRALDTASALLDVLGQMLAGGAGAGGVQETASTALLRASAARVGAALAEVGRLLAQRLALLLFPTDGYAKLVGEAKWERKSVETEPSPHVYAIMKDIRTFAEALDSLGVSSANAELLWTSLVDALWGALVEGLSRVRKCTNEGRALMSLDLQTLQHSLKSVVQGRYESVCRVVVVHRHIRHPHLITLHTAPLLLTWWRSTSRHSISMVRTMLPGSLPRTLYAPLSPFPVPLSFPPPPLR